ncbi:sugar phosphate transporter [Chloropicon primus]|uniref:Sugar phosphate transporter n=1 Tax=Chloropicon primus TaxID=1764295 RepID=A0A5B8MR24_9CHLO|nr:sugar phosphate transporter [Chloropicon primus]UPR02107.1 sugar phosphate transporter [Chloropicon primus]|mmetsp:Transcript_330/g.897  ORF Transcript_330/g.897 Transcript_330/m.897 type:complete len:474 (+) Transcript_330:366-1787(+)|eukprot:QDZ22883.1 sugar phosphate transporter [Chloropicon primus]
MNADLSKLVASEINGQSSPQLFENGEASSASPQLLSSDSKAFKAASRIQQAFTIYKQDRERAQRDRQRRGLLSIGETDKNSLHFKLKVIGLIGSWYTLSTTLTVFNKAIYGAEHGKFPAPLLVTGSGMLLQFFLCRLYFLAHHIFVLRESFPEAVMRCDPNLHTEDREGKSWVLWAKRFAPVSFMTGLDYGASNLSFVYITVSFYTMCKSSSPLFLLMFAFLLKLEQPSFQLTGIMGIIMTGVMMSVFGEVKFNAFGFFLVMLAAFLSGWRWGYVQLLLQKGSWFGKGRNLQNSVITLYNMTPLMSGIVLFFSLIIERPWKLIGTSAYFSSAGDLMLTTGFIVFSGSIAFLMVLAEFVLVAETSAVTFTVAGALKELLTIFAGIVFFGDKISAVNGVGLGILIIGVFLYNRYKIRKHMQSEQGAGKAVAGTKELELDSLESLEDQGLLNGKLPSSGDAVFSLGDSDSEEANGN